jgi:divalent metal cation (Fe/Co/Zn/Cd) transporter
MDAEHRGATVARQPAVALGGAVLGALLGWAGARPLSGLAVGNVVLWALAVVALGAVKGTARAKALRLGIFGFVLGFAFMCFGYSGEGALVTRTVPFALIGLFCSVCAIALGAVVHLVRARVGSRP